MALTVTSDSFKDGEHLGSEHAMSADYGFGCAGGNISPALSWSGAPEGTKSFTVTCYDPDAPTGCGFWHWVVVNIPPDVTSLPAGAGSGEGLPAGALQTRTDVGKPGYAGPCPPEGREHRYVFTVSAVGLDALPVDADTSAAVIGFQLNFNALETARITALYKR
jgi:Raf kinase inhibitor-like YbhB/YbcL family protein